MFNIVLYQPEIPPNTGNIIRLCTNVGACLHLIHPLGFNPDDKQLKRAGLDYHIWSEVKHYDNYDVFLESYPCARIFACTTKATDFYNEIKFNENDFFLFGPETRGLPSEIISSENTFQAIKIPMQNHSRSLNLSNSVAVILYEAWRQHGFK